MAVPTWLSAIGHVISDVAGAIIGTRLGDGWKQRAAEEAGAELKRILLPDREDILKELLNLGDEAEELVCLLKEANRTGFITVQSQRYTENWIVNMLLKVEAKDRLWVYPLLNDICRQDHGEFFTLLEILHNDGFAQWLQVAKAVLGEKAGSAYAVLDKAALKQSKKLQPTARRLRAEAKVRGWRSWVDC